MILRIPATPRIVVLVPAYNEAASIGHTLRALVGQTRPADLVVAIPNGCTDSSTVCGV